MNARDMSKSLESDRGTEKELMIGRLLAPKSIAVVGASPDANSVSGRVRRNLKLMGYTGKVYLVSRTRDEVDGEKCFKTIDDLPHGIDAAVLIVPQVAVEESIESCARVGIGGIAVFASGFAEGGDDGIALQKRIGEIARKNGIALLGPNCMGLINYVENTPLSFEEFELEMCADGPQLCIVGQSGAMTANTRLALIARGLRVSYSISTGNEAACGVEQFMSHLVESKEIDLFAIFAETLRNPQLFLSTVRRARELGKPVVLLHTGRSKEAQEAAKSHTGALAGDHDLMRALVSREGVSVVDTLDEFFDVTAILARYPKPISSMEAAVISNSGALRGIAIDMNADLGVKLARLNPDTLASLAAVLPAFVTPDNPLDITTAGMQNPWLFGESSRLVLADPKVGSLVMALMGGLGDSQVAKAEAMIPALANVDKPVAFVLMGDETPLDQRFLKMTRDSHLPFFRSPDRALRAMAHVHKRAQALIDAEQRAPKSTVSTQPALKSGPLAEYKGKQLLKTIGIATPKGELAKTVDDAIAVASKIGYPVVIKAQADELMHKSDVGGVAVGIKDDAAMRDAWTRMQADVAKGAPGLTLDGILVEGMASKGVEMVLGARRDEQWGLAILIGMGGVWIEALNDVRLLPPDLSEAQIESELKKLKGAALLDGIRGQPAVDTKALAAAVRKLSDFLVSHEEIVEVDINPLLALPQGKGVIALDAVFVSK